MRPMSRHGQSKAYEDLEPISGKAEKIRQCMIMNLFRKRDTCLQGRQNLPRKRYPHKAWAYIKLQHYALLIRG